MPVHTRCCLLRLAAEQCLCVPVDPQPEWLQQTCVLHYFVTTFILVVMTGVGFRVSSSCSGIPIAAEEIRLHVWRQVDGLDTAMCRLVVNLCLLSASSCFAGDIRVSW